MARFANIDEEFETEFRLMLISARRWREEVGLLEEYRNTRMEAFFTGWYLRKLVDVPEDQRYQAILTIQELGQMYGGHEWLTDEAQEFWNTTSNE